MDRQFLLIHPWLYSELGHSYIYSKNIQKAAEQNGWDFTALLPKKSFLDDLPSNWLKVIDCPTVRHWYLPIEGSTYRRPPKAIRAKQRIRYYKSLYVFLKKMMKDNSHSSFIFFMEAFGESDVRLLSYLLRFLPAKRITVGLVHRYQSDKLGSEVIKYRKHHERITQSGANLYLFTDSDLLKEDLEKSLYYPFQVLPIHYIEKNLWTPFERAKPIRCWWPGIVREGKGLEVMQQFATSSSPLNESIELVFNEEAEVQRGKKGPLIRTLPAQLKRADYLSWLQKSQVILLPYTDPHYQKATSSIFIEAVMAGRIPLVYPKTWMAYELKKYGLEKLVIDCDPKDLSKKILDLPKCANLLDDLGQMRNSYLDFHRLNKYADILKDYLSF